MKRIPMMLQLTLVLFCVMVIPTSILTWYSGTHILWNSEEAIASSSLAGLNANRKLGENALNNLAQNTVRMTATNIFDRIRSFETYGELNTNFTHVNSVQSVLKELLNLNKSVDGVYSSYFLLDGADYVVSTDKGITTLQRYEPIEWMDEALEGRRGIGGVWYSRKLASGVDVISYVLPLNRLSTTTRGTIVVNLRESQMGDYLRSSEPGKNSYMLMNADGIVISHNDKSLLYTNGSEQPYIQDILNSGTKEGYAFHELEGERVLYTWSRSSLFGWLNVNQYSVDELMTKTHTLQRSIIVITSIIIFFGTVITVFLATWISKPARELVRALRARRNLGMLAKNEFSFLDAAFKRMQEEEEGLHQLLLEREQDTRSLAIHNLLRGEVSKQIADMFPEPNFLVAVVSIDNYRRYESKTNPETRVYHRYLLAPNCENVFSDEIYAKCVYRGEGCFAIVINYGEDEYGPGCEELNEALYKIREMATELLGYSVTIGVSSQTKVSSEISDRVAEAMEVIKNRMIEGSGHITYWRQQTERNKKYIYPANSEGRILNYLESGDLDSIIKELALIREEIQAAEYIAYDNIIFIYNQLVGVTIKQLRENNISTARIFEGRRNIYSTIASIDTLDELEDYLQHFFSEIIQYLARNNDDVNYGEKIIRYLEEHFCDEIIFDEMAKEIGISYSYMRKIVNELTGKSLIEYTNQLRIEKAKQLLLESNLSMTQIASQIGYLNVQSFNRFFRKYEGIPPSSYKASKSRTS